MPDLSRALGIFFFFFFFFFLIIIHDAQHTKRALRQSADDIGPDQPAHSLSVTESTATVVCNMK